MSSGERPVGTAKGKQPNTEALCHPPSAVMAQALPLLQLRYQGLPVASRPSPTTPLFTTRSLLQLCGQF